MKIAIMGAGSLGTIAGALITKNGGPVVLIDANKAHVKALNEKGATITGKVALTVPVKAITPEEMHGLYDIVFLLVKQTHTRIALDQLLPHLGKDSLVCTLQNGLPEDKVAEIVGVTRTAGGTVSWAATWIEPGVSMLNSPLDMMELAVGELDGQVTPRIKRVAEVLGLICRTDIVTNLRGLRWAKLWMNATISGMSTILGCNFGQVIDSDEALYCMAHIGNEAINTAQAMGIQMESILGLDIRKFGFKNKAEMEMALVRYRELWTVLQAQNSKASMLQDLEKGLKTEIDALNGMISFYGKKAHIPTPVNDRVVEIIKWLESGKYRPSFENLKMVTLAPVPED